MDRRRGSCASRSPSNGVFSRSQSSAAKRVAKARIGKRIRSARDVAWIMRIWSAVGRSVSSDLLASPRQVTRSRSSSSSLTKGTTMLSLISPAAVSRLA